MTWTTAALAGFLGKPASLLRSQEPFRGWPHLSQLNAELGEPRTSHGYPQHGLSFQSDSDDRVYEIVVRCGDSRPFQGDLGDLRLSSTRGQAIEQLGSPTKGGAKVTGLLHGENGPWDRWDRDGYLVHILYRAREDRISRVTLMWAGAAAGLRETDFR
jgi:hypothetical protein